MLTLSKIYAVKTKHPLERAALPGASYPQISYKYLVKLT